jgi:Ferritin-like domain
MIQAHTRLLATVFEERDRILSRRSLLAGGLKYGAAGAMALGLAGTVPTSRLTALAQDMALETDLDVLQYALTLEHLEYSFYRDGIGLFTFGNDPFGGSIDANLMGVRDHEGAHVQSLTEVITGMGGEPVSEATYDFGYGNDPVKFLATAAALENTGVMAYDGAGKYLQSPELLTAAGGIVAVEARHASYLNLVTGAVPFPEAYETAKEPAEILEIAGGFIVG